MAEQRKTEMEKMEKKEEEEKEYFRVMQIKQISDETREHFMMRIKEARNTPEFEEARRNKNRNLFARYY